MNTIFSILEAANNYNPLMVAVAALRFTQDELAEANVARMLDGFRSDGSEMPIYSFISQTVYGYPNERIKLRDTGEFQDRIIVSVDISARTIKQTSTDSKTKMLVDEYGEEIFGTFGVYKQDYIERHLEPAFIDFSRKALGL